ncbi:MAG: SprT-like domain-containing protein [Aulosira sp. ZfuVER01]|nr:SprT-like domain-containing protein [Aulosira sp. ZfuVER01]MDZ7998701.1 SprT-like domain-containing protein [Aulosira sp. DedVER01a]MDZ8054873.1 SprT-like domain-containing protein [Aulosira sp. ZfuCHP01]
MQEITQLVQLYKIYEGLNIGIFDRQLPENTVLKIGHKTSDGNYRPGKWDDTRNQKICDEIEINDKLLNFPKEEWLAVLVHQMIHQWQYDHGNQKTTKHYHNQEYVKKAAGIGLIIKTGYENEQSIDHNGKFMQVIQNLDSELILKPRNVISQVTEESKNGKKKKYTCPSCGFNSWAKPGATNICCNCNGSVKQMIEQIKS